MSDQLTDFNFLHGVKILDFTQFETRPDLHRGAGLDGGGCGEGREPEYGVRAAVLSRTIRTTIRSISIF